MLSLQQNIHTIRQCIDIGDKVFKFFSVCSFSLVSYTSQHLPAPSHARIADRSLRTADSILECLFADVVNSASFFPQHSKQNPKQQSTCRRAIKLICTKLFEMCSGILNIFVNFLLFKLQFTLRLMFWLPP